MSRGQAGRRCSTTGRATCARRSGRWSGSGADVERDLRPAAALDADGLVVPGVGAFAACMAGLARSTGPGRSAGGWPAAGRCSASASACRCCSTRGVEHGVETEGCGVLARRVEPLRAPVAAAHGLEHGRRRRPGSCCSPGIDAGTRFYFVHSYAAHGLPTDPAAARRWSPGPTHGEPFVAAVENGALCATQFHPEKSGDAGAAAAGELAGDAVTDARRGLDTATLTLLPAVDVADGQAVRLVQGEAGSETSYGEPLDAALAWQAAGRRVDPPGGPRRGLRPRRPTATLLAAVVGRLDVAVELSGGIRDDASLARRAGDRLRPGQPGHRRAGEPGLGREAIAEHGDRIAVGLDVRGTHAAPRRGWTTRGRRALRDAGPAGRRGLRPLRGHRRATRTAR